MNKQVSKYSYKVAVVIYITSLEPLDFLSEKIDKLHAGDICVDVHVLINSSLYLLHSDSISLNLPNALIHTYDNEKIIGSCFLSVISSLAHYDWALKLDSAQLYSSFHILFEKIVDELIGTPETFFDTVKLLRANKDWIVAGLMQTFLPLEEVFSSYSDASKIISCENKDFGFFVGNMYWFKPEQLLPKFQLFVDTFDDHLGKSHNITDFDLIATYSANYTDSIGLILPIINSNDSKIISLFINSYFSSVNKASIQELTDAYKNLDEDLKILEVIDVLDINSYSRQVGINFESKTQAYKHFILIGQFNGFAEMVKPIRARRLEHKLIDWDEQSSKTRVEKLVSIIIPVYNNITLTIKCLKSLRKHTKGFEYEVIIIDNASKKLNAKILDNYVRFLKDFHIFHMAENLNFSLACNYGLSKSSGHYIIFLNNDTQVIDGWLSPILESLNHPEVVAVQPKLLYMDNTVQCAGVCFCNDGFGYSRHEGLTENDPKVTHSTECEALTAACIGFKAHNLIELKGFDTWFINGQEDMDLCMRIKKAYPLKKLWYESKSTVYHHTSQTEGRRDHINQNRTIFKTKWLPSLEQGTHLTNLAE